MTTRQEAQWVLRAQVGDREAIEALLRSAQPLLTRYVRAIVGAADAEDVTQDVMVLIYRKLWMLSTPDLFRPWIPARAPDLQDDAQAATGHRVVGTPALSIACRHGFAALAESETAELNRELVSPR